MEELELDLVDVDKIIHRWHPKDPTNSKYEETLLEAIKFSLTLIPVLKYPDNAMLPLLFLKQ